MREGQGLGNLALGGHSSWGCPTHALRRCNPSFLQWLLLCPDTIHDSLVPKYKKRVQSCHLLGIDLNASWSGRTGLLTPHTCFLPLIHHPLPLPLSEVSSPRPRALSELRADPAMPLVSLLARSSSFWFFAPSLADQQITPVCSPPLRASISPSVKWVSVCLLTPASCRSTVHSPVPSTRVSRPRQGLVHLLTLTMALEAHPCVPVSLLCAKLVACVFSFHPRLVRRVLFVTPFYR